MPRTLVRTSERSQFKRCRQAWWWAYVDHLKPATAAPALRFGGLVHAALAERYPPGVKRGPHPARTFERLYQQELETATAFGFRDEDGTWQSAGELGVAMLEGFVDTYGKDEQYRVVATEQTFQVGYRGFLYVGTFDGVWQDRSNKRILFKEWKTSADNRTRHLALDEQAGAYWTFGPPWLRRQGILEPGQELTGILYTFLRKAKPDDRPRNAAGLYLNKDGSVSKVQPPPLFHREWVYRDAGDRRSVRERVLAEVTEMRMVRRGRLAVYKNPNQFNCAGCGFRDICELHETGADWEAVAKATMVPWGPYDAHDEGSHSA